MPRLFIIEVIGCIRSERSGPETFANMDRIRRVEIASRTPNARRSRDIPAIEVPAKYDWLDEENVTQTKLGIVKSLRRNIEVQVQERK